MLKALVFAAKTPKFNQTQIDELTLRSNCSCGPFCRVDQYRDARITSLPRLVPGPMQPAKIAQSQ